MKKLFPLFVALFLASPCLAFADKEEAAGDPAAEAQRLNQTAGEHYNAGRYQEAIPFALKALEQLEQMLGHDNPALMVNINNLAAVYAQTGKYEDAERLYKRAIALGEKSPEQTRDTVNTMNNLAEMYRTNGLYAEAEPIQQKALEMAEKGLGPQDPAVSQSISNLGLLYQNMGRAAEAEPLHRKALELREAVFGPDHPAVAQSLNNLAALHYGAGRYTEAEPLYIRALQIKEATLGPTHPEMAPAMNNLAELYRATGRFAEAEQLYGGTLDILVNFLGEEHPYVAATMNNLGELYRTTGKYGEAEKLLKASLTVKEKVFGADNAEVAMGLNNLAELYRVSSRPQDAESLYRRSLGILEKTVGKEHRLTGTSLNNLALLLDGSGRSKEAEPLYRRALGVFETSLGKDHPEVAQGMYNLAVLLGGTGKHPESHALFTRSLAITDRRRDEVFALLSEHQKLEYIQQNEFTLHAVISHTASFLATDRFAVTDTFNAWLRWKGVVAEAQGRYLDAALSSDNPEIAGKFARLAEVRRELARHQLAPSGEPEEYGNELSRREKERDLLEAELSRLSRDFALDQLAGRADAGKLAEIVPRSGAYVDFASIPVYDFTRQQWGPPRYFAFLLLPGREPGVILTDLGAAADIDRQITAYLKEITRPITEGEPARADRLQGKARLLYDVLVRPLLPALGGRTRLFVSPDGNLNLLPFELLVKSDGKYLMNEFTVSYVGAGRDLVRFSDRARPQGPAMIVADPDYNLRGTETVSGSGRTQGTVARDLRGMSFAPLPDTRLEAGAIAPLIGRGAAGAVKSYLGKDAVEGVLFSAVAPRIIHLATHGFFLKEEDGVKGAGVRGVAIKPKRQAGGDAAQDAGLRNPMLRSGIVLAGANASLAAGGDEGLLTAEKILGLKLKGTDLVVLSACETGLGEIRTGEGVFGLKRAFLLSGAKTLVMSLWSVPSTETTELMTEVYRSMGEGKGKAEALRQAKLIMMKKKPHPFYWGAFVLAGNPE